MFGVSKDDVLAICSDYFARTMKAWTNEVATLKATYKLTGDQLNTQFEAMLKGLRASHNDAQVQFGRYGDKIDNYFKRMDEWKKNWEERHKAFLVADTEDFEHAQSHRKVMETIALRNAANLETLITQLSLIRLKTKKRKGGKSRGR